MRDQQGQHHGLLEVSDEQEVRGQIIGDVHVLDGGRAIIRGQVAGSVIVDAGGSVLIVGMIAGKLLGAGRKVIASGAYADRRWMTDEGKWSDTAPPVGNVQYVFELDVNHEPLPRR